MTTSGLVGFEKIPMNLAYLPKASVKGNQVPCMKQVVVPMVKVILLKLYLEGTSRKGLVLA
jgi:hypothetical protein